MKPKYVIFEKKNRVAKITLNKPEVGNALDLELARDFLAAVSDVESDSSIRVLILTGAGKAFCSGGNVKYLLDVVSKLEPIEIRNFLAELGKPIVALRKLSQPVLAAINGGAVGVGFDLLLHCDLRVASENAVMGPTWVRNGIIPVLGGMYILPKLIGQTRATEMILRGQTVLGKEAQEIGLVNRSVPLEKLDGEVMAIAEDLAKGAPLAVSIAKRGLQRGMDLSLHHELEHSLYLQATCMKTEDFKRGLMAFLEKREAEFSGN